MKMVPQERRAVLHARTHTHRNTHRLLAISRARRHSAGFTIVQVFTERRPRRVLIKPDIYSGTVAKSHRGEWDLEE